MSDVTSILADMKAGKVDLAGAKERLGQVKWAAPLKPLEGDELWAATERDSDPDDSPQAEFMAAYYDGTLSDEQYAELYPVVSGSTPAAVTADLESKVRYVRTAEGMRKYGEPVGSPIITSREALAPKPLKAGRSSSGVSTKKKSTSGLVAGDEVLTQSSGVGRSVKPSASGGELRRVSSVEDAEAQHGPSSAGKRVVRFEDGSFTGPVGRDSEWGVADRSNAFSKNDEDGPRLLTVEGAKRKRERDAAAMAERMKGVEVRRSGNNTKLVVNGEVVGEWIDPKQIVANNYKDNPEAVAKQVEVHRKKKLIEEYVRADTDLSFADWSAGR